MYRSGVEGDPCLVSFEIDQEQLNAWFTAHLLPVRLRLGETPRPRVAVVRYLPRS